jgi:hypothetical protein
MMPKAQPATDTAGGQIVNSRTVGTAIPAGAPDASALARGVPAARSAATSAWAATATLDSAIAPAASAPEATITRSATAPVSTPAPGTPPSLSATPARSSTWQANLARLEGLAEVLSHHGLRARLMTPPGRVPSLHVVNPSAAALAEDVYAGRGQDGLWWFWWSWAERIAVGEDLEGAASLIKHVLAASS